MTNIFVDPNELSETPPQSIRVSGECYELVGGSQTAIDTVSVDGEFEDCEDCETVSSSSLGFSSSSSSGIVACECVDTGVGAAFWLCAEEIDIPDGNTFSTWNDLSGNNNNGTTVGAGNSPTYRTNQVNGLPIGDFGGLDNVQIPHNASVNLTTDATMIAVYKGAGGTIFAKGQALGSPGLTLSFTSNKVNINAIINAFNTFKVTTAVAALNTSVYTVVTTRITSLTTHEIWYNGILQPTTDISDGTMTSLENTSPISVGVGVDFFDNPSGSGFPGNIAEFIYFPTSISDITRSAIESCLISRYGL